MPCVGFHALLSDITGSIPAHTWFLIPFDTEVFDEGNFFNPVAPNYLWRPPSGLVTIKANAAPSIITSSQFWDVAIFKNGGLYKRGSRYANGCNLSPISEVSFIERSNGTDYYQAYLRHTNPVPRVIFNNPIRTYFSGACLGRLCELT